MMKICGDEKLIKPHSFLQSFLTLKRHFPLVCVCFSEGSVAFLFRYLVEKAVCPLPRIFSLEIASAYV